MSGSHQIGEWGSLASIRPRPKEGHSRSTRRNGLALQRVQYSPNAHPRISCIGARAGLALAKLGEWPHSQTLALQRSSRRRVRCALGTPPFSRVVLSQITCPAGPKGKLPGCPQKSAFNHSEQRRVCKGRCLSELKFETPLIPTARTLILRVKMTPWSFPKALEALSLLGDRYPGGGGNYLYRFVNSRRSKWCPATRPTPRGMHSSGESFCGGGIIWGSPDSGGEPSK
ncbi:hypothetical protein KSP39_PZI017683 [Platanthera zijinensis]|uniref:Uncharacterized protein n=1 Tax=Platanthera zijinensis TaxID=2320716 RepID=A0AAP0FZG7_9ASPA